MAELNLHYVDELIGLRQDQHGGGRGAPPIEVAGVRQGASINRSCIVLLSALMQTYVEDVFHRAAKVAFPVLRRDQQAYDLYWKQLARWGNPSDSNIANLFLQIGVPDIFEGLSWQRTPTIGVRRKLNHLNQVRNRIAHGAAQLTIDQQPYSLTLAKAIAFRNFSEQFALRFEDHAVTKVRRSKLRGIVNP